MVSGVECLLVSHRAPHSLDCHINAVTASEVANRLYRVCGRGIDDMGCAEFLGPGQLAVVQVHADYRVRPSQSGSGDGRIADSATAKDGHRIASANVAGVHSCAQSGHYPAANKSCRSWAGLRRDFHRLTSVHQGQLGKCADAQGR